MLPALRPAPVVLVGVLSGFFGLWSCAQADESGGSSGATVDASTGDAAGSAGTAGAAGTSGMGGEAGTAGAAGSAGSSGASGASGGSGGTGATGGTGGYAGTGGTGFGGAAGSGDAGIICGGEVCTDWLCENAGIGLSMTVFGCCQQTNECGAVNDQGGAICVPVAVIESLLNLTCKPD